MALKSSKPISQAARELEVNPEKLRSWTRQYERDHGTQSGPLALDERTGLFRQDGRTDIAAALRHAGQTT